MASRTPRKAPSERKPSPKGWFKRTFSHRRLIAGEALLVVGLLDRLGRQWVLYQAPVANWLKIVILMALVIGIFGGLLLLLQKFLTGSLAKTHEVVKALPLPTPLIFIHAAAFAGLFFLYAWATGLDPFQV